ncbi:hypothetical protein TNCV_278251 [Trichonephila clavipes]|nr:hypothetical protein TNCV_278251 [Trichonephila clavipes]
MGGLNFAKKADMHYVNGRSNCNDRAALRMYHTQFPDRRILDHRTLQECTHFPECLRRIGPWSCRSSISSSHNP